MNARHTDHRSIPSVFETTIRYLAGMLSAYELSGKKYPELITQAEILANRLSGAWSRVHDSVS